MLYSYAYTGILRDKTMDCKLMYVPIMNKQNYPFCRLKWLIEKFGQVWNQPIKIQ